MYRDHGPGRRTRRRLPTALLLVAVLAITAAVVAPAHAGKNDHRSHPAYVDGAQFLDMADPDGSLIEVNIKGKLLKLLTSRAVRRHDEQIASILADLVSVQAVMAEIGPSERDHARQRLSTVARRLIDDGWERFVRVRENSEEFSAYVHFDREDEIDGIVVLGFLEKKEVLFVNLAGRVDMEKISILGERLGVPGLEDLPTPFEIDERQRKRGPRRKEASS